MVTFFWKKSTSYIVLAMLIVNTLSGSLLGINTVNAASPAKVLVTENFDSGSFNSSIWQEIENDGSTTTGPTTGNVKVTNQKLVIDQSSDASWNGGKNGLITKSTFARGDATYSLRAQVSFSSCASPYHIAFMKYTNTPSAQTTGDLWLSVNNVSPFKYSLWTTNVTSTTSATTCTINSPTDFEWILNKNGGHSVYINNSTTPAISLGNDSGTFTTAKSFLIGSLPSQITTFDNVVLENDAATTPTITTANPGNGQVSLSWSTDPANLTTVIGRLAQHTDYIIEYKETSASNWLIFADGTSTGTIATVTGLNNGTSYDFRVSSVNLRNTSDPSILTSAILSTTASTPGSPTSVSATAGNAQAIVSFTPPVNNGGSTITEYRVTSTPGNITATGTASPITITGLTNGTAYTFTVTAKNSIENGVPSDPSPSIIPVLPLTPSEPRNVLYDTAQSRVHFSWSVPTSPGTSSITDYIVEYKLTSSTVWSTFSDTISTNTVATVTGLTNGESYDFRIRAINSVGTGTASLVVTTSPQSNSTMNYILSYGQSLSLGSVGTPAISTGSLFFNNKMLNSTKTGLLPLSEPIYNSTNGNTETISTTLINNLTQGAIDKGLSGYSSLITLNGAGNTTYLQLKKGTTPYSNSIATATTAKTLVNNYGKNFNASAITIIHGENDTWTNGGTSSGTYAANLLEWWTDFNADLKNISGQIGDIPLFTDQTSSFGYGDGPRIGQWLAARDNPNKIYLVAPKYMLDYSDGVHINNYSERRLGEYYGKVMKKVLIDGEAWLPLSPKNITLSGAIITAKFHVPVGSIVFDTTGVQEIPNYGFEYSDSTNSATISGTGNIQIISPDTVQITLSQVPTGTEKRLKYAYKNHGSGNPGAYGPGKIGGNLRDSDTTPAILDSYTPAYMGNMLRNWMIAFNEPIATTPSAPTAVSATAGNAQATVTFTAPTNNGGSAITEYTVTSSPGGFTATGTTSPITVTGLTNGTSYTFIVTAKNTVGTSSASTATTAVTPTAPDTTSPVVTLVGSGTINILRNTSYTDSGATWSDNVDGTGSTLSGIWNGTGSFTMSGSVNTSLAGSYSIQYQKVDAAGNKSSIVTRTVIVNPLAYTVYFKDYDGSLLKTQTGVTEGTSATAPSNPTRTGYSFASWSGSYDNIQANTDIIATYTINQYTLSFDSAGGSTVSSIVQDYNSSVTPPTNPTKTGYTFSGWSPSLPTTMPSANGNHTANWTANSYTVSFDANGGDGTMTSQSFVYDIAQSLLSNIFTRTGYNFLKWNTQPNGGGTNYSNGETVNNLTSVNGGTVTLYSEWKDIESPVISANGSLNMTVEVGSTYTDAGATALDNKDGDISSSIITNGTVDTATLGSYTLTYDVTDAEGNVATTVTRTVTVVDTTAPVVTLVGDSTIDTLKNTSYTDNGATWTDNVDGTGNISSYSGSVTITQTGSYELWYRHTDMANNTSTVVKRTVNVISGNIPVITLIGSGTMTIAQGANYTESGATVLDSEDGDITANIVSSGSVNTSQVGTYTIQYSITDTQDNTVTKERTINVTDQAAPVITLSGASTISVTQGANYIDLGATWVDNVDGTGSLIASGSVDTNIPGNYTLTYSKTDTAGNTGAMLTRIVTVIAPQSSGGGGGGVGSSSATVATSTPSTTAPITTPVPVTSVQNPSTLISVIAQDISRNIYRSAIETLLQRGAINNVKQIEPNRNITRAEFIKITSIAHGYTGAVQVTKTFSDLSKDHSLFDYVNYGVAQGWISTKNADFRPNDSITQGEIDKILNIIQGKASADTIVKVSKGVKRGEAMQVTYNVFFKK